MQEKRRREEKVKKLALLLLLGLVVSIPASSDSIEKLTLVNGYVISETNRQECKVETQEISCAFLLALVNKIKAERREKKEKYI